MAAFGGDGDAITIFGESAGGNSVINHIAAPASAGLFVAAVIESGAYDMGATTLAAAEATYVTLKEKTRCVDVHCLRELSTADLLAALPGSTHWGPVVDGHALKATPLDLISSGTYNKVPVMLGSNRDEGAFFVILEKIPDQLTEAEYDVLVTTALPNATVRAIVKKLYAADGAYAYPKNLGPYSHWWWVYMRAFTDEVPGLGPCAARWLSRLLVAGGTPSVHTYFFSQPTACNMSGYPADCIALEQAIPGITSTDPIVVPHAVEINYAFGVTQFMPSGEQAELARLMSQYWATFGRSGLNPNVPGLPEWPAYNPANDTVLRFEGASGGGIRLQSNLRQQVCDFWTDRM